MNDSRGRGFGALLLDTLAARRAEAPEAIAIEPLDGGAPWSVERLLDEAAAVHGLLAAEGVAPGDRVLVQTDKSPRAAAAYLGILSAGAVHVPLNPAYTDEEREHFLDDAEPALLVCAPDRVPPAGRVPRVLTLDGSGAGTLADALAGAPRRSTPAPRGADDPAAILYTSGTTGRSKGAVLTHGNLEHGARVLVDAWGWRSDDVLVHALPIFHVHGLFVALHCAWLGGGRVLWLDRFDAARVVEALPRATVLMGVPTFYTRLLAEPALDRARCAAMRLFVCGSAPLTEATFEAFEARTGHRILERYGMSETLMNVSNPLDGERIPGTVGFPLPGTEVRVCDDDDREVPDGTVGQLHVRGPNVFTGYRNLPERTRSEFTADGFFRTGDLGTRAPDGRIAIVGRAKDLVISGGYNIYPREVERLLDEQDGVAESAVIGVPHADLGEAVVAVVVPAAGAELTEASVLAGLADRIARFKQPRRVVLEDALPRNAMGKVQKNVLRDRHRDLFPATG
jgi:malonyl-CoA/methylmalonyl-CoA synthetase